MILQRTRRTRTLARLRAVKLNDELLAGGDPGGSRLLVARALQLTSRRSRAALAEGLQRLLRRAQMPASPLSVVRVRRDAVCANASALAELALLLDSPAPLYAQGVAALERLLGDGTGPAYRGDAQTLAGALEECRQRMTGVW
jgi:hypothetical protein